MPPHQGGHDTGLSSSELANDEAVATVSVAQDSSGGLAIQPGRVHLLRELRRLSLANQLLIVVSAASLLVASLWLNSTLPKDDTAVFIAVLYSIAISLGFSQLPANPLKEKPTVLVFLFTLAIAGLDWFYHHRFRRPETLYYAVQVLNVVVLSQLFRHSHAKPIRPWLRYFVIYNVLAICWDFVAGIANPMGFVFMNVLLILVSAIALAMYNKLESFLGNRLDPRYVILGGILLVLATGVWIVPIFNQ